jgi:hypothetical protein
MHINSPGSKEAVLFWKKNQKNFTCCVHHLAKRARPPLIRVFWFFFKKELLFLILDLLLRKISVTPAKVYGGLIA